MAEERVQRRLGAILAADVVGYSRLIERDETGTLAILKQRRRAILVPLVTEHHGRIIKVMGDGVVDAGDLYGDGVIIAVRLQAMADPGGILVSRSVHDQVGSKLPLTFDDLGSREVKTTTKPVRVFRVRSEEGVRTANLRPEH